MIRGSDQGDSELAREIERAIGEKSRRDKVEGIARADRYSGRRRRGVLSDGNADIRRLIGGQDLLDP